jgi:hypothetical protein
MFDGAKKVEKIPEGIRLTGPKDFKYELEPSTCMLLLQSAELSVRSGIEWPFRGYKDGKPVVPRVRRMISAVFSEVNSQTFAFKNSDFLGPIKKITLECHEGADDEIRANVWPAGEYSIDELTLHILIVLSEPHFKETFHPIWLRQAKSTLNLHIDCMGFRFGPEAAFAEPDDKSHYVLSGSAPLEAHFLSIYLQTSLGVSPPPLPD